jgi:ubiquinone/menaquinone biosynthesis C-methylase UbiE/uncharacterized protein YbaR (Trm112 family)
MKEQLLEYLRCPFTLTRLSLTVIQSSVKKGTDDSAIEIEEGYLTSEKGYIFPVIKGVPRLLLESFIDHREFLSKHIANYNLLYQKLMESYGDLILSAIKRNKPSRQSFSFEWSYLKPGEKTNIWYLDSEAFSRQLFKELHLPDHFFTGKIALDIGCGHGRSSRLLAEKCKVCIGSDLSESIEKAHRENGSSGCFFIQADLHHLPLAPASFDIVYCSGVLHHTPDTYHAFECISKLPKKDSVLCIWLYHPVKKWIHQCLMGFRKLTIHLPLRLQVLLYSCSLVPVHKMISRLRSRPKSWREILIVYLDLLSPKYRYEHTHGEVKEWFEKNDYTGIEVTSEDTYGFSMKGVKIS